LGDRLVPAAIRRRALARWTGTREFPPVPRRSFAEQWPLLAAEQERDRR
jgi:hypothetical protein